MGDLHSILNPPVDDDDDDDDGEPTLVNVNDVEYPTSMKQTALVFLDDPLARRLVVGWSACGGNVDRWSLAAGIPTSQLADAYRVGEALRMNGICRDGGVVDELAEAYIAAIVRKPLEAKRGNQGQTKRRR